jgi:hypothetical protein
VLDLYAGIWDGAPLGSNDYVICADEKTSIQAPLPLPSHPAPRARPAPCASSTTTGAAAPWPTRRPGTSTAGRSVAGASATGIAPFSRVVKQVMTAEPYTSARRVFWIVDNGSSHRGAASVTRMTKAWPHAHLIHLPAHASWLDQAEIYFSIVQRKALTPNDFTSLDQVRDRLTASETRYNAIAKPFTWTFTCTDLDDLLHRIDAHETTQPHALAA